jgi:thiamine-phosphate pyrophosphorylase
VTLCLITDRRQLSPDARTLRDEALALMRWLEPAAAAGIDVIQLRERDLPARWLEEVVTSVRQSVTGTATRVVVNDRADVAMAVGCDGVHVRSDGPPVMRMRSLAECRGGAETRWVVGRSVHSATEARVHADADYLVFGAVFGSGPKPARGVEALRAVVAATSTPVFAVGGVTPDRVAACLAAGAAGVAAIGLFLPPGRAACALGLAAGAAAMRRAESTELS